MRIVSLKTRILLGAFLWSIGLLAITFMGITSWHMGSGRLTFLSILHLSLVHVGIAALCMYFGLVQLRRGISSITQLRNRLAAVHKGVDARIAGAYPAEVQPLVDELNALLDERDRRVARAISRAGDLAHGLKTPLAVLSHEAEQVRTAGQQSLAAGIDQQIDRMRRQIDYHLANARSAASAASPTARTSISESAGGIVRVLQRLHADRGLIIDLDVPPSHAFRGQREDLDEMLGNLLDNACKWARTRVKLTSTLEGEQLVILIDDDGPGIDPAIRETILQRGVRADEALPGSGLGLAIVRDVAEIYGGTIALESAPTKGARARLTLPHTL